MHHGHHGHHVGQAAPLQHNQMQHGHPSQHPHSQHHTPGPIGVGGPAPGPQPIPVPVPVPVAVSAVSGGQPLSSHAQARIANYSRLPELADSLRIEVEHAVNDLSIFKQQRDDLETKLNAQVHELMNFQQQFYELERAQKQQKANYEDEIQRLHKELDLARGGNGNIPPINPHIDRHGYKSSGAPQYPENIPPPVLASGENGSGVFGALMGGGSGNSEQRVAPQDPNHPSKRMRGDDQPGQQQVPPHQLQHQPGYMGQQQKPGPLLRQEHGYGAQQQLAPPNANHSPSAVGPDMKRKLPPSQSGSQYSQGPPPHMQQQQQGPPSQPKPQYPPQQQQHGYQQGPPPPQHQQQPQSHYGAQSMPPQQQQQPQYQQAPMQQQQQIPVQQQQVPPGALQRAGETGICDLDGILSNSNPTLAQWKKQGGDWTVVYNPKSVTGKGKLDVSLAYNLDHGSVVCCVKFSNDGQYLATGCNRTAQVFDAHTGQKLHTLTATSDMVNAGHPPSGDLYIRSVCFSPDSSCLATGAEDKVIRVWELQTRTLRYSLRGHEQDIYSMDWSRDGRFLVSGSGDRSVRVWDAGVGDNGGRCLMALLNEDSVPSVDQKDSGVTSVAINPIDGRCVAAASLDMKVRIWDLRTGRLLERFEGHRDSVYSVAFSQDGRSLVSASLDKTLKVWDLSPQTLQILSRPPEHGVMSHAVPNNPHPAPASLLVTNRCRHTYGGHRNYVLSVAYPGANAPFARSTDGSRTGLEDIEWVVSASKDRSVTFWDAKAGAGAAGGGDLTSCAQFMLQGHKNSVISIAMSATEGLFATGSGDLRARIWKITPVRQE
ncbi:general transcription repressor [Chytriomyces hyalinus]|nr:general transcription repressor [Chytriomyces hyalinus]